MNPEARDAAGLTDRLKKNTRAGIAAMLILISVPLGVEVWQLWNRKQAVADLAIRTDLADRFIGLIRDQASFRGEVFTWLNDGESGPDEKGGKLVDKGFRLLNEVRKSPVRLPGALLTEWQDTLEAWQVLIFQIGAGNMGHDLWFSTANRLIRLERQIIPLLLAPETEGEMIGLLAVLAQDALALADSLGKGRAVLARNIRSAAGTQPPASVTAETTAPNPMTTVGGDPDRTARRRDSLATGVGSSLA
ncbi:MAG: hypothetical protein MI892_13260, partial [Desulfobacterales bacterium]|nr:hypothetical protein [Desulfobacterales bacterium]